MTCPVCGQVNPEGARFCSNCGAQLSVAAEAPRQSRKIVTVVFSDVTGSTELGERLDPESLSQLMASWYERMRAVLEAHGGTVQKFIGDAVMAVFGIPVTHEDDAVRAVRAAEAMHGALEELNRELAAGLGVGLVLRTGLQTGEVVAGNPALGDALVVGDPVNVAARLEQAAEPGQILLGEATWRLARDAVTVEPRAELTLRGKRAPVAAFALRSVLPHALGHARRHDTPMVGRAAELELLAWTWERVVRTRKVQLVTVLGQAGVGKSRLTAEALAALDPPAHVLTGRCLPYGDGITWWPVAEIVRQAAAVTDADQPAAALAKLAHLFDDSGLTASVARLIGLERGVVPAEDALWAIRRLLALLAGRAPLVVVLDDLHWAEPTLLDLIERAVDASADVPLLVVCLARPELLEARPGGRRWAGGKPNASTLLLQPLSDAESHELLAGLAGGELPGAGAADVITAAAGGNPLFLEELLASLIEDGRLARSGGHWSVRGDLGQIVVPPSIQALLAARLDRLDGAERAVIDRASVIGQSFERSAVVALSPERVRPGVAGRLTDLVRRELLRPEPSRLPGEQAYEFRHLLLRDAAYDALPKVTRASLHERFAAWLEATMGERVDEYEEIVGYHLEQAWRYRAALGPAALGGHDSGALAARASARLAAAGRRALARGDPLGGVKLLERAKELLAPDDLNRLRLLTEQAECHMAAWDYPSADRALEQAAKGAERAGDAGLQAYALLGRLWVEHVGGDPDYDWLRAQARQALEVLERVGDDRGAARAWHLLSIDAVLRCRVAEAEAADEKALELALAADDTRTVASIQGNLSLESIWGPVPVADGIARCERILAEAGTNRRVELATLGALAVLRAMDGQTEAAAALVERAMAIGDDFPVRHVAAQAAQFSALAMMLSGDAGAAEARLRAGYGMLEDMGDTGWRAELSADLARVLFSRGRVNGAEAFALTSLGISDSEDLYSRSEAEGVLARVLAHRGEASGAIGLAGSAVALADRTDMLNLRAEARADLAEVLRMAGRRDEADAALAAAIELYERKGNRSSAAAARRLLGSGN